MGIGQFECLHNGFVGVNRHAGTGPAVQYAIVAKYPHLFCGTFLFPRLGGSLIRWKCSLTDGNI